MTRFFLLSIILFPAFTNADAFLCIPEKGVIVEDGNGLPISTHVADVAQSRYILSNSSGEWIFKAHGKEELTLNNCTSEYFCEAKSGYSGTFFRSANTGVFSLVRLAKLDERNQLISMKGYCSEI